MARQMYCLYMAPLAPFLVLVLATVLAVGVVLGPAGSGREQRQIGAARRRTLDRPRSQSQASPVCGPS
jgi:hypothetical protein